MTEPIIVIGGGPAGIMASLSAAQLGQKVLLLEKNNVLGKKLAITGNGRCNLTHFCSKEYFFSQIVHNYKFFYSAYQQFNNEHLISFMQELGVKTKVEKDNRVFPQSNRSKDVIEALIKGLKNSNVVLKYETVAQKIIVRNQQVTGVVLTNGEQLSCKALVLATGGLSYPQTGSTGDGYKLAEMLGHSVEPLKPGLVPIIVKESWVKDLSGLSFNGVMATLFSGEKKIATFKGDVLFTHFGLSGPAILSLSSYLPKNQAKSLYVSLDLKPEYTPELVTKLLQQLFDQEGKKQINHVLEKLFPKRFTPYLLNAVGITQEKAAHEITRQEKILLVEKIKNLRLEVLGTRSLSESIITRGGMKTPEINPKTLESRQIKGLFFAGEILDIDALTGGFNLQIAFSTGYLSGLSAALYAENN